MFSSLNALPADPLLGLIVAFNQDPNPNKVDLGVGVYRDDSGKTPIFASVKAAEARAIKAQETKTYIGPAGSADYCRLSAELIFGRDHLVLRDERVSTVQTPGGCGALRVAAELIKRGKSDVTVWVSDPTWPNHQPLLGDSGLKLNTYPYFDKVSKGVDFERMLNCLETVTANDVVLLHACCHNPSGADLSQEQWQAIKATALKQGFTVFIDSAYQGFGLGLEQDVYGVRLLAESLPELIVANSCSKNFGLYRDRTGSLCIVTNNRAQAQAVQTHVNKIVRGIYSMPPAHGAAIVETLLADSELTAQWQRELAAVRNRIFGLRKSLADTLNATLDSDHFRFIEQQVGMFSYLGLNPDQVKQLREQYSIYMAGDSRINVAGLKQDRIDYVADAIASLRQA